MNFDGVLFQKVTQIIRPYLLNATINRVFQVSASDFSFTMFKDNESFSFFISTNPNLSHFVITDKRYSSNQITTPLLEMLKQHLEGGNIMAVTAIENERILQLTVEKTNEIGAKLIRHLFVELTGKRTNILLTKEDETILDALNKLSYDEGTKRMIARGLQYHLPEKKENFGLSAILKKEKEKRGCSEEEIISQALASDVIYIYDQSYHLLELTYLNQPHKTAPILKGIHTFYDEVIRKNADIEARRPILKTIKNETSRLEKKIQLIDASLHNADDAERYKRFGDLIFTYAPDLSRKQKQIAIVEEEKQTEVVIPLDEKYDIKYNASRFYHKYKKLQTSIAYSLEQKRLCLLEIDYFDNLQVQLDNDLSSYDLEQIRQELIRLQYIKSKEHVKKIIKPKMIVTKYISNDGSIILVGKNNIQNNYISFELANPSDTFFHVKDFHGAHVLVRNHDLSEQTIRLAAKIAAYYSKARNSSSIPVDYTSISNIKKISGDNLGKVSLKKQKTIYIDIDEDLSKYLYTKN